MKLVDFENRITEIEPGKYLLQIFLNGKVQFSKEYPTERQARNGTLEFMFHGSNTSNKRSLNNAAHI